MKSPWSICWLVPLGWITGLLLVMLLTLILLSHPESFVDQALRGFEDLDIVLILARGLDHLDQLGGAIDRRFPDIAVGVGERVDRKSTRLNSSHSCASSMPSSASKKKIKTYTR